MNQKTNYSKKLKNILNDGFFLVFFALVVFAVFYWQTSWNTEPVLERKIQNSDSFAESIDFSDLNIISSWGISKDEYDKWADESKLIFGNSGLSFDADEDGLVNFKEYLHGTDPKATDTDGDGYGDGQEVKNGYDPSAPGDVRPTVEIVISKIKVSAPMVWSKSENEKEQLADLQNGVAHFPYTAFPGQAGNMIISGHSSNYIWVKGSYNYIFRKLNDLNLGDIAEVKTVQQNGKTIVYRYEVNEKFSTVPNDERIFEDSENPVLTLSTCWPIGSNSRRLIVRADLVR